MRIILVNIYRSKNEKKLNNKIIYNNIDKLNNIYHSF